MNPHNRLIALDPPRSTPPRRWRCVYCHVEGLYDEVVVVECSYVYPPCSYCGQTPTCALDCTGIAEVLGRDDVYLAGLGLPKGHV